MYIRTLNTEEMRVVYDRFMVEDFPKEELKSFRIIERLMRDGQYICCGLFGENKADGSVPEALCGYGLYVFQEENGVRNYLIDYLAIRKDVRDRGIGSAFLRDAAKVLPGPVGMCLVEAEDPESAADAAERTVRKRRIAFYERGGYHDTGIRVCLFGVRYVILEKAGRASDRPAQSPAPDPEHIRRVYCRIYEYMLGKELLAKQLQIIP